MESTNFRFSSLFFFFLIAAGYFDLALADDDTCVYKIQVQTGNVYRAGTNSRIRLQLSDSNGKTILIPNLADWGVNGPNYDYFERASLDVFNGKGACIHVCGMTVTSDGSGGMPGWYLDYVKVTTSGPNIPPRTVITFNIDRWLATSTSLSASIDMCYVKGAGETGSANSKVHANERSGPAFDILRALE